MTSKHFDLNQPRSHSTLFKLTLSHPLLKGKSSSKPPCCWKLHVSFRGCSQMEQSKTDQMFWILDLPILRMANRFQLTSLRKNTNFVKIILFQHVFFPCNISFKERNKLTSNVPGLVSFCQTLMFTLSRLCVQNSCTCSALLKGHESLPQ